MKLVFYERRELMAEKADHSGKCKRVQSLGIISPVWGPRDVNKGCRKVGEASRYRRNEVNRVGV